MTPEKLIDLLAEAGMLKEESAGVFDWHPTMAKAERFAALVAAAEREKVARWMMERGYSTGHGDTTEDLLQELDWQIAENWNRALINGITTEREACANVCEILAWNQDSTWKAATMDCAAAIRARRQE
jgi:hypothetical protein